MRGEILSAGLFEIVHRYKLLSGEIPLISGSLDLRYWRNPGAKKKM
jgi:hypothetical protein